jgi:hypothetical protein
MYGRMSLEQENLQKLIFQNTPIDTIVSTHELPNGVEVRGYAGGDSLTYRIYDNGTVVEK